MASQDDFWSKMRAKIGCPAFLAKLTACLAIIVAGFVAARNLVKIDGPNKTRERPPKRPVDPRGEDRQDRTLPIRPRSLAPPLDESRKSIAAAQPVPIRPRGQDPTYSPGRYAKESSSPPKRSMNPLKSYLLFFFSAFLVLVPIAAAILIHFYSASAITAIYTPIIIFIFIALALFLNHQRRQGPEPEVIVDFMVNLTQIDFKNLDREALGRTIAEQDPKVLSALRWAWNHWFWGPYLAIIITSLIGFFGQLFVIQQLDIAQQQMLTARGQSDLFSKQLVLDARAKHIEPLFSEARPSNGDIRDSLPRYGHKRRSASMWALSESEKGYAKAERPELARLRLTGAFLEGLNLVGIELPGVIIQDKTSLAETRLANANLGSANLTESVLHGTIFSGATLDHANLQFTTGSNTIFDRATLSSTRFDEAQLVNASLQAAKGIDTRFESATLENANFNSADLEEAVFASARLNNANFADASLSRADFTASAQLADATFLNAKLHGARFSSAIMNGAELRRAELHQARIHFSNLSGSGLEGAKLVGATLSDVNLQRAHLQNTDFSGAFLTDVDFSWLEGIQDSKFTGATFESVKFYGVDLTYIELTPEQLAQTCGDDKTQPPSGMDRPKHWHDKELEAPLVWSPPGCPPASMQNSNP